MNTILIGLGLSGAALAFGYFKGRSAEKTKQLKVSAKNAIETKKREAERRNDSIDVVRKRMKEFTREN